MGWQENLREEIYGDEISCDESFNPDNRRSILRAKNAPAQNSRSSKNFPYSIVTL
jgi:hypothetical protein